MLTDDAQRRQSITQAIGHLSDSGDLKSYISSNDFTKLNFWKII